MGACWPEWNAGYKERYSTYSSLHVLLQAGSAQDQLQLLFSAQNSAAVGAHLFATGAVDALYRPASVTTSASSDGPTTQVGTLFIMRLPSSLVVPNACHRTYHN